MNSHDLRACSDQDRGLLRERATDLEGGAVALADQVQLVDDEQRHIADRLPLLRVLPSPRHLVPLLRRRDRNVRLRVRANYIKDAQGRERRWEPRL